MTTRFKRTFTPQAVDRDGICAAQQMADTGALIMNGILVSGGVATLDTPAHISFYSAGNLSARTFSILGTDRYGNTLLANVTGPNNSTVATTENFKTVTLVTVNGAVGTDVEVGVSGGSETAWIPLDRRELTSVAVDVSASANFTYGLQYTYDDPFLGEAGISGIFDDGTMTGKTADFEVTLAKAITAIRLKISSYVAGGLVLTGGQTPH